MPRATRPTQEIAESWSATSAQLDAISCAGARDCEAVGQTSCGQGYAMGWRGGDFVPQSVPLDPSSCRNPADDALLAVSCPSATSCLAVGSVGAYSGPLVLGYDGHIWQRVPPPPGPSVVLDAVSCVSADACAAGGQWGGGNRLLAWWDGRRWFERRYQDGGSSGLVNVNFTSVSCSSATSCLAVGGGETSGDPEPASYAVWNGRAWRSLTPPPLGADQLAESVSCTTDGRCTVVGSDATTSQGPVISGTGNFAVAYQDGRWHIVTVSFPVAPTDEWCVGPSCSMIGTDGPTGTNSAAVRGF